MVPQEEEVDFFSQYQWKEPDALPLHKAIRGFFTREWAEVETSDFPRFLTQRFPLMNFQKEFPSHVKVDSLMAGLAASGFITEDASPNEQVDKKVDTVAK